MRNTTGSCGSVYLLFCEYQINCKTFLDNFCRVADALQWKHLIAANCTVICYNFYGASSASSMCDYI